MAFPTNPTNGQIYKNLEWNASRSCWVNARVRTVRSATASAHPGTQGQNVGATGIVMSGQNYNPTVLNLDNQSCWNTANGEYAAKEKGSYLISWNGLIETSAGVTAYGYLSFQKNGSDIVYPTTGHSTRSHTRHNLARAYEPLSGSILVDLNVGDRLAVRCWTPNGGQVYASIYTGITVVKVGG